MPDEVMPYKLMGIDVVTAVAASACVPRARDHDRVHHAKDWDSQTR